VQQGDWEVNTGMPALQKSYTTWQSNWDKINQNAVDVANQIKAYQTAMTELQRQIGKLSV